MYKLYSDGGARGNPGPSACAFVLFEGTLVKFMDAKFLGDSTNNRAEYEGLLKGLEYIIKKGIGEVECYLDSELVVKQLNGLYKVKDETMRQKFDKINLLVKKFKSIKIVHVAREENMLADRLVNIVLDQYTN